MSETYTRDSDGKKKGVRRLYPSEYGTWACMKKRCLNPKDAGFHRYGGRGIKVCKSWLKSFMNFYRDMGPRPTKESTLDRINNNGNYCKKNCRWTDRRTQVLNREITTWIEFNGEKLCHTEWAARLGGNPTLVRDRIEKRGWTIEMAVTIRPMSFSEAGKLRHIGRLRNE